MYPRFSYIFFLIFIFLMVVVLMNLLNGLAVRFSSLKVDWKFVLPLLWVTCVFCVKTFTECVLLAFHFCGLYPLWFHFGLCILWVPSLGWQARPLCILCDFYMDCNVGVWHWEDSRGSGAVHRFKFIYMKSIVQTNKGKVYTTMYTAEGRVEVIHQLETTLACLHRGLQRKLCITESKTFVSG